MTIAGIVLSASLLVNSAQAGLIEVADWHLTSDSLGGLRQSSASDDIYYAVSKLTTLNWDNTFEALDGFHFANYQEWRGLVGTDPNNRENGYLGQGGWSGYTWEGQVRAFFLFADTQTNNRYKHAGNSDTTANLRLFNNGQNLIAGFVMVKDEVLAPMPIASMRIAPMRIAPMRSALTTSVPEPSSIAIIGLGLAGLAASRKKRKSS